MIEIRDTSTAAVVSTPVRETIAVSNPTQRVVEAVSAGPQGAPGATGADGGTYTTKTAAQSLGGHRIVRAVSGTEVDYASADDETHGDDIVGMTIAAASAGATVQVANEQDITEPSWNWTPLEPLYLGLNGLMTQTPPASPSVMCVVVGFATSATSARIRIEPPIYL